MAIDSGEYKSKIGLDNLWYALVSVDDAANYTVGTPKYLAPAAEASQEPTQNSETQYADDQAYDVPARKARRRSRIGDQSPADPLAELTGRRVLARPMACCDNGAVAPYCALLFRSLKSNGSYRYYAFMKGKFDIPAEAAVTKGETPEPQILELTYRAIKTVFKWDLSALVNDGIKRMIGDDDADGFDGTTWFDAVPEPLYGVSS
jgi:phi13 family phage major tail protein